MKTAKYVSVVFCFLSSISSATFADPCEGKGTAVFFVNGLFNNKQNARDNLDEFQKATQLDLTDIKNLSYDLAWVEGHPELLAQLKQLAGGLVQRGVDDFQHFWLWLSGLEKAPDWFEDLLRSRDDSGESEAEGL